MNQERQLAFYIGKKTGNWTKYDSLVKRDREAGKAYAFKVVLPSDKNNGEW